MGDSEQVLEELRLGSSLFLTELSARTSLAISDLAVILDGLPDHTVVVTRHVSPDHHITTDLRIASFVYDGDVGRAVGDADRLWRTWLMNFLRMHRCA